MKKQDIKKDLLNCIEQTIEFLDELIQIKENENLPEKEALIFLRDDFVRAYGTINFDK